MALPQIISRNAVQVPGGNTTVVGRVTSAATGIYTVPTGKVSRLLSGSAVINVVGADASSAVAILRSSTYTPIGAFVIVNEKSVLSPPIILQAADIFTYIGDSGGTNATMDMSVTFQEFDV